MFQQVHSGYLFSGTVLMKLTCLHPRYFTPDEEVVAAFNPTKERYFIVKLVELKASHGVGKRGINDQVLRNIVSVLEKYRKTFISAERALPQIFFTKNI
jgi:predicted glycosyltransferase